MDLTKVAQQITRVSDQYAQKFGIKRDSDWYILKLQEELGELIQSYLMMTGRGRQKDKSKEQITEDFHQEMADVFCHVLLLARHHKINLEKEVEEKSYNDQDGEITIKKKVKGTEDVWFALQEPTRFIAEEGECYYASQFSKFVQAGLLTRAMLQKRILDDKGLLSQKDNEKFSNLYVQLTQLQVDLYGLRLKDEKDLSSEEQEKLFNEIGKDKIPKLTQKETEKLINEINVLQNKNKELQNKLSQSEKLQQKINRTKEFNSIFVTFLMIITNPLSIILYTVILSTTYLNNAQTENYFKLLPAISILVGDMIWWACFLLVIHYFRAKINYKYFQLIDKIVSIAIIIFGIVNVRLIV